jgi:hypothetical protein
MANLGLYQLSRETQSDGPSPGDSQPMYSVLACGAAQALQTVLASGLVLTEHPDVISLCRATPDSLLCASRLEPEVVSETNSCR